jgi:hypothetical protein
VTCVVCVSRPQYNWNNGLLLTAVGSQAEPQSKKIKESSVPVSYKAGELRIAVSSEQLDTVGRHIGVG